MKLLRQWFRNFLKNIEKANQESFGDKKLDCCGLNTNQQKNSKQNEQQE